MSGYAEVNACRAFAVHFLMRQAGRAVAALPVSAAQKLYHIYNTLRALIRTLFLGGWRPLRAAALPVNAAQSLIARIAAHFLMRQAGRAVAALPVSAAQKLYHIYNTLRALIRTLFLMRLAAAEGSGPPS